MNIIIFLLILSLLVFVHELGHFLMAKWNGVRVDTFAIGFEPTLFRKKVGETTYKINLFLFGGYVKIFGENPDPENMTGPDAGRSLVNKKKWQQAVVLFGGILFNIVFAFMVLTITLWAGAPTVLDKAMIADQENISDMRLIVLDVLDDSPAKRAGLQSGDVIITIKESLENTEEPTVIDSLEKPYQRDEVIELIQTNPHTLIFTVQRPSDNTATDNISIPVRAETGVVGLEKQGIGVSLENVGTVHESFFSGIVEGVKKTASITAATVKGFVDLITGKLNLNMVSGPVGLVGVVGDASQLGFIYILNLIAVISINLAVLNLIPFPALDGGRLLFLLIEKIKGSAIPPSVANTVNAIGFGILILFMIFITVKDVIGLF